MSNSHFFSVWFYLNLGSAGYDESRYHWSLVWCGYSNRNGRILHRFQCLSNFYITSEFSIERPRLLKHRLLFLSFQNETSYWIKNTKSNTVGNYSEKIMSAHLVSGGNFTRWMDAANRERNTCTSATASIISERKIFPVGGKCSLHAESRWYCSQPKHHHYIHVCQTFVHMLIHHSSRKIRWNRGQ